VPQVVKQEVKKTYTHPKFEFIAAQLPLHSISEDVNSPYFASSPSNITGYVRRQSTPNQNNSCKYIEAKGSSNTESNEEDVSDIKNLGGGTIQTTTSVSDNFLENANIERLERKLNQIVRKRTKRIEIFENYLNEWEKEKLKKSDSFNKKPKVLVKTNQVSKSKSPPPKSAKKVKKATPSLYQGPKSKNSFSILNNLSSLSPVLQTPQPILSARKKNVK
jgi:hypothetical protein